MTGTCVTNADGRWVEESSWRANFDYLGLPYHEYRYAARLLDYPGEYLVRDLELPGIALRYLDWHPNTDLPLEAFFVGHFNVTGSFPYGIAVEPD